MSEEIFEQDEQDLHDKKSRETMPEIYRSELSDTIHDLPMQIGQPNDVRSSG